LPIEIFMIENASKSLQTKPHQLHHLKSSTRDHST
jgi:hypothetical protein